MSWMRRLRRGLRALVHRKVLERDMDEEMRFHVEMEAEELLRERTLAPEEARWQALVAFGGVERCKREGRALGLPVHGRPNFAVIMTRPQRVAANHEPGRARGGRSPRRLPISFSLQRNERRRNRFCYRGCSCSATISAGGHAHPPRPERSTACSSTSRSCAGCRIRSRIASCDSP